MVPAGEELEQAGLIEDYVNRWAKQHKMDPELLRTKHGWEMVIEGQLLFIKENDEDRSFTVLTELILLPEGHDDRSRLLEHALRLNIEETLEAWFGISNDWLMVTCSRPVLGLDYFEFLRAVQSVANLATDHASDLREQFTENGEFDLGEAELE